MDDKWTEFIYRAFLVFRPLIALCTTCQHSPVHTYIHRLMAEAGRSNLILVHTHSHTLMFCKQFGVQCLPQGHHSRQIGGDRDRITVFPISGQPALEVLKSIIN